MGTEAVRPGGRAVTDAGVRHVRLAYQYLDEGDLDGHGSLLAAPSGDRLRVGGAHDVHGVLAGAGQVSVIGVWTSPGGRPEPFVDVFGVTAEGLLVTRCAGTDRPPRRTPP